MLIIYLASYTTLQVLSLFYFRMFCLYISSLYVLIIALLTISDDCVSSVKLILEGRTKYLLVMHQSSVKYLLSRLTA